MRKRLALILLSCDLCVAATAQQSALTVGTATAVTGRPLPDSSKCRWGATWALTSRLR